MRKTPKKTVIIRVYETTRAKFKIAAAKKGIPVTQYLEQLAKTKI